MKRIKQSYIIPLIATGTFILGIICLFLPFLPFGWLLMFMTALLITPYFSPIKKLLTWIIEKDKTGTFDKARKKVANLYHWVGDKKGAAEMNDLSKNSIKEGGKA